MMNLYPQNRRSRRGKLLIATVSVFLILIFDVLSHGLLRAFVRTGASYVYRASREVVSLVTPSSVSEGNQQLQQLQDEAAQAQALLEENTQLRALLSMPARAEGIAAPVILSGSASPYGTFVIGAGSANGIQSGEFVQTAGGYLLGIVTGVAAHQATVTEIFHPDAKVDIVIDSAQLQASGEGGGNGRAQAPRELTVREGDPVFAQAYGAKAVGIVGAVASTSAGAAQDLYIRVPVNVASQLYVYVAH